MVNNSNQLLPDSTGHHDVKCDRISGSRILLLPAGQFRPAPVPTLMNEYKYAC